MSGLQYTYAADHPAARGHFPDNPVIPGAVLLSDAVQAVGAAMGANCATFRVIAAKFLSFVRPGEAVTVEYASTRDGAEFVCRVEARVVLSGKIAWSGAKDA